MRALTSIRSDVLVKKVEHRIDINEIFVEAGELTWEDVVRASLITNMVILDDRRVYIEMFDSMEAALKKYPDLRAYEERIIPPVRVVVIDGFDYAACMMPHLDKTGDAYLFIPVSLNRAKKNRYTIKFLVAESAIDYAIKVARLVDEFSSSLSSDIDRVLNALNNLLERNLDANRRVRLLSKYIFENAPAYALGGYHVKYVVAPSIDMDEVGRLTNEWIKDNYGIVVAVSLSVDGNKFLLASNEKLGIDLRIVANKLFSILGGRGGGRNTWVMGRINDVDNLLSILSDILRELE